MTRLVEKTVYSFYYPEVQHCVGQLWREEPHGLYDDAWERTEGAESHLPYLDAWKGWSGVDVDSLTFGYPTNGASEALFHLIAGMPPCARIHVFRGEYEGYARYAESLGRKVVAHDREAWRTTVPGDFRRGDRFFVSDPSGIDGEYWEHFDGFARLLNAMYPYVGIVLDVSYVGTVQRHRRLIAARHPNVAAVAFSLSKPFGVYGHRLGGCFSRRPMGSLHGNRWFKNYFSIELGRRLLERYAVDDLPRRYAPAQAWALERAIQAGLLPAETVPANVVLLAVSHDGPAEYRRRPDATATA